MKKEFNKVLIGVGLGPLKFGMTKAQVKQIAGEPDEVEVIAEDELDNDDDPEAETGKMEIWHYDENEFSVSFDELTEWRMVNCAASSSELELDGVKVIGLELDKLTDFEEKFELGDSEVEELIEDSEEDVVCSYWEKSMSLWFEGGNLMEVQWGPLFDEEEEIIWPA